MMEAGAEKKIDKGLKVRCAVCGTLVERTEVSYDEVNGRRTVKVWCHGKTDEMALTDFDLVDMGLEGTNQLRSQTGVAFSPPPALLKP